MFKDVVRVIRSEVCDSVQKSCKSIVGGISCRVTQVLVVKGARLVLESAFQVVYGEDRRRCMW